MLEESTRKEAFRTDVIRIVQQIPHGKVLSYGAVATLAGSPKAARAVAGILRSAHRELPWHRVVNQSPAVSVGGDTGRFLQQIELLRSEGVAVSQGGLIDKDAVWSITEAFESI